MLHGQDTFLVAKCLISDAFTILSYCSAEISVIYILFTFSQFPISFFFSSYSLFAGCYWVFSFTCFLLFGCYFPCSCCSSSRFLLVFSSLFQFQNRQFIIFPWLNSVVLMTLIYCLSSLFVKLFFILIDKPDTEFRIGRTLSRWRKLLYWSTKALPDLLEVKCLRKDSKLIQDKQVYANWFLAQLWSPFTNMHW